MCGSLSWKLPGDPLPNPRHLLFTVPCAVYSSSLFSPLSLALFLCPPLCVRREDVLVPRFRYNAAPKCRRPSTSTRAAISRLCIGMQLHGAIGTAMVERRLACGQPEFVRYPIFSSIFHHVFTERGKKMPLQLHTYISEGE